MEHQESFILILMTSLLILAGGLVVAVILFGIIMEIKGGGGERARPTYQYAKKKFLLTRAEHECYDALKTAVGTEYHIFPQVHLTAFVDNKVVGQNWKAAFRHINQKSVDFLLCDKANIGPVLAIELDDRTHERPDRIERDTEVERILHEAEVPLLRIRNNSGFNSVDLANQVRACLEQVKAGSKLG